MARIQVIPPEDADGELKRTYDAIREKRGAIANVHAIHSLHPTTMTTHIDFYLSVLYGRSRLKRAEREAIAVAVSHANECGYCVKHHADALSKHLKDDRLVQALSEGRDDPDLSRRIRALVRFAVKVTLRPGASEDTDIDALREVGLDDEQILMATLTAAYFNFVNRVVLTLDVGLEDVEAEYDY